jgi:hypothetical protein
MPVNSLDELKRLARVAEHVGLKPRVPRAEGTPPAETVEPPSDRLEDGPQTPAGPPLKMPPPPASGL